MKEYAIDDLLLELEKGVRVIFQVRHAERPKMDPDDPTFGDSLPLTPEGTRTARLLGERLRGYEGPVAFYASPLLRTRQTARLIAEGMGREPGEIPVAECLGNGTFYYDDPAQVLEVFKPENFFEACFRYMDTGEMRGFNDLKTASDALEAWLDEKATRPLTVVATHDLYIASFLAARGAYPVRSKETWPRFLDGAAILIDPDGTRRYAFVRTGLSAGIVGVRPDATAAV
jgi:broad specificity phosphatase PhoE